MSGVKLEWHLRLIFRQAEGIDNDISEEHAFFNSFIELFHVTAHVIRVYRDNSLQPHCS